MDKAPRILLWGGLALLILSVATCGIGLLGGIASGLEGEAEAAETGGSIAGISLIFFGISILMIIAGAFLKAIGKGK